MVVTIQYESAYAKSIFNYIRSWPSRRTAQHPSRCHSLSHQIKGHGTIPPWNPWPKAGYNVCLADHGNKFERYHASKRFEAFSFSLPQLIMPIMVPMLYFASIWMVKFGRMLTSWIWVLTKEWLPLPRIYIWGWWEREVVQKLRWSTWLLPFSIKKRNGINIWKFYFYMNKWERIAFYISTTWLCENRLSPHWFSLYPSRCVSHSMTLCLSWVDKPATAARIIFA